MREIIFRGKRLDTRAWAYGLLGQHHDGVKATIIDNHFGVFENTVELACVDPATVGQYTGLTDKNGKRIFEGDIVQFRTRVDTFKPLYVRWYKGAAQFVVSKRDDVRSYPMDDAWTYEVIGNIHDNPELLEGGGDND